MSSQTSHPPPSTYDAAALLAPKAPKKAPSKSEDQDEPSETGGMGSMVERLHKVQKRQDRPVKRQKREEEHDSDGESVDIVNQKQQFSEISGTGEIGQHLKEQREKLNGANISEKENGLIDLTLESENDSPGDNNEDEIIVTKDDTTVEVCLGRIENARVNAHRVPSPKSTSGFQTGGKIWMAMPVSLSRRPGSNSIISVCDPLQKDFGTVDQRTASALCPLMDGAKTTKLRLQARLDARPKKPFDYPGQAISDHFAVTINVYAQKKFVPGLGKWLSQHQIWLRQPLSVDRNIQICNPHKPQDIGGPSQKAAGQAGGRLQSSIVVRTHEEVKNDIIKVFDTLEDTKDLPEMSAPRTILTELLPHQKQAMYFLNKREQLPLLIGNGDDGTNMILDNDDDDDNDQEDDENKAPKTKTSDGVDGIWQKKFRSDGRPRWVNLITGHEVRQEPSPLLGGILADVMGLGKTLTILSLIAGSITQAREWSRKKLAPRGDNVGDEMEPINSKGTLLVCPLSTIVNWEEQIKNHLKDRTLSYCVYQGQSRTNDPKKLLKYDLVITTYQSVGNEYSRTSRNRPNKPLFDINWFRVVLDEAHQIRNTASTQSKAACQIQAERRWCVTGTPVQNRLEDLGALIKFLKIKPFDEQGAFSRHISTPLRTGNQEAIPKLRILVDLITLRRLKDKLNLPDRKERFIKLNMSEAERNLYDQFSRNTNNTFSGMSLRPSLGGKSYAQVLKAINRLRMLCAHGSDMLSDEDWDFAKGFDATHAIDLEDEGEDHGGKTPQQAFEMLALMKDAGVAFCSICNNNIEAQQEVEELEENEDETIGFLTPCNQLLCPRCIKTWSSDMEKVKGPDNRGVCTICDNYIRVSTFKITQRAMAEDAESRATLRDSKFARNIARYSGPHTKTIYLLGKLKEDADWNKEHENERPIKSVVFSEWTTHLDLIQLAFTNSKVQFVRLDGSMSFSKRTVALETFATNDDINVILVSIKAGGLGLNLTAASKVYVMEPNYNPQAEQQAIERVHRLGQTRDVYIDRLVMADSIEEKVVGLQKKKMALAHFSVERDQTAGKGGWSKEERAGRSKKVLEDLRDLLR